jgi:hypothetical protein
MDLNTILKKKIWLEFKKKNFKMIIFYFILNIKRYLELYTLIFYFKHKKYKKLLIKFK